jgi:beta-lactamase class A
MQVVDGLTRRNAIPTPVMTIIPRVVRPRAIVAHSGNVSVDGISRATISSTPREVLAANMRTAAPIAPTVMAAPSVAVKRPVGSYFGSLTVASIAIVIALSGFGYWAVNANKPAVRPTTAASTQSTSTPKTSTAQATAAVSAITSPQLQQALAAAVGGLGANSSVSVYDTASGASAATNADQPMVSASLYKLFVALAAFRQIDSGAMSYGTTVPGTGQSVSSCLNRMITISDNACGEALGTMVGWERQNSAMNTAGFTHTQLAAHSNEITSASDVNLLLKRLYDGTLLSPNSNQAFLDLLKAQTINNRLPVGLPAGTVVAHKTGDLNGLVHDAGIVYGPKGAYIITVMSGPWSNVGAAPNAISALNQQIYQLLQK